MTMGTDNGPGRKPQVPDEEILAVFERSDDPVLMAKEVAEELPIGRRAVYDRLRQLKTEGILESKKTGARSSVWWYPSHTKTSE
jgi:predicted transcriptional regulator